MANKIEADAAYENSRLVAHDLLCRISDLLADMPTPDEGAHWGHVGTVSEANSRLAELVAFLESTN